RRSSCCDGRAIHVVRLYGVVLGRRVSGKRDSALRQRRAGTAVSESILFATWPRRVDIDFERHVGRCERGDWISAAVPGRKFRSPSTPRSGHRRSRRLPDRAAARAQLWWSVRRKPESPAASIDLTRRHEKPPLAPFNHFWLWSRRERPRTSLRVT